MGDLMDWAVSIAEGQQAWKDSPPLRLGRGGRALLRRARAVRRLRSPGWTRPIRSARALFQGPVADALTHVGQLAMMRRMAGAPIRGENYFKADITAGRVGLDQSDAEEGILT